MDLSERIAIERDCTRLVQLYCNFVDAYRHDELVALWATDGVWETWKGPLRSHAEMRAYLDAKPREPVTLHIPQNILIDVIDADHATAISAFTYHDASRDDPTAVTPRVVGRWQDRFVRRPTGWLFAHRTTEMLFRSA